MATAPMDVDSESGKDSKALAGAVNFSSSDMVGGPLAKLRDGITIIKEIQELFSSDAIWNKRQCKRIADRCGVLAEMFGMMVQGENESVTVGQASSGGCNSGEAVDGLLHVLEKVKATISCYVNESEAITHVLWWTNNPTAFMQLHGELDAALAKNGFVGTEDAAALNYGVESKMNMLRVDAEEDKEEMLHKLSQRSKSGQSAGMNHAEKLEQVVSDRTADLDVKELDYDNPDELPSYLKLCPTDIIEGEPIRIYKRKSKRDPAHEVGWAEVKRGKLLNCDVAIKVFNCAAVNDRAPAKWNQKQLLMEAGSLVELAHPRVVQLVGYGQYAEKSFFVMECMDGDLRNFMEARLESEAKPPKPFTDSEELDIITQIAQGLYFIHSRGYAHGDLKCSNLVVSNRGQCLEVKIADLRGSQKKEKWNPEAFKQASMTRRPRWTALEALDSWDRRRSWEELTQMDIYSFGMTCYEIVTGKYPFDGIRDEAELVQKIMNKERPELPEHLDEQLRGLITSCWDQDPAKRPSFVSIFQFLEYSKSLQKKDLPSEMILRMMLKQCTNKIPPWWESLGKAEYSKSVGQQSSGGPFQRKHLELFPESRYLEIAPEQLKRVKRVGSSKTARVYKITWLNCTFAEKVLRKHYSRIDVVQPEIEALIKVSRHPYLVHLVGLSVKPDGVCSIVMEYIDGNLRELMDTRLKKRRANWKGPFDCREEVQIISKIALGMAYVHSRNLVHRDLKSDNVLAQVYPGTNPTIVVKIADFGLSHLDEPRDDSDTESHFTESSDAESNSTVDPREITKTANVFYSGFGTGFYRAPEMLPVDLKRADENLSELGLPEEVSEAGLRELKATDVFSFAMTCYEVLTGNRPCSDLPITEYAKIRSGHRPTWPESTEAEPEGRVNLKLLVEECWRTIPQRGLPSITSARSFWRFQSSYKITRIFGDVSSFWQSSPIWRS